MPSNLTPTTRECVHLVTRGHFWSRDKDGGHTIRSAISENPMLHANLLALCFIELELRPLKVLQCKNWRFLTFLLLWPWPCPHKWTWPVFPRDIPDVQIWTSYVKVFERHRLTDRHDWN